MRYDKLLEVTDAPAHNTQTTRLRYRKFIWKERRNTSGKHHIYLSSHRQEHMLDRHKARSRTQNLPDMQPMCYQSTVHKSTRENTQSKCLAEYATGEWWCRKLETSFNNLI